MSAKDEIIGRNIRLYRRAQGMTLETLSRLIYKSKATLGKYEKGLIALDINTLDDIAHALQIHPQMLLTDVFPLAEKVSFDPALHGEVRYLYHYEGNSNRIACSLVVHGDMEEAYHKIPVTMFCNVPSVRQPEKCRSLYCGYYKTYDSMIYYLFENYNNPIEHMLLFLRRSLDQSGTDFGMLSGISSRSMNPMASKCLMCDVPQEETGELKSILRVSKGDLYLISKYNVFITEQSLF